MTSPPEIGLCNVSKWVDGSDRYYVDMLIVDGLPTPIRVEFLSSDYITIYMTTSDKTLQEIDLWENFIPIGHVKTIVNARKWFIENYYTKIHPKISPKILAIQVASLRLYDIFFPEIVEQGIPKIILEHSI